MTVSLLEKARAGRIACLASLNKRNENVVSIFDAAFMQEKPKPAIQFISQRSADPLEKIAA